MFNNHAKSSTEYNTNIAQTYSMRKNKDTAYVAYRDLPEIISRKRNISRALDFGCGTGFSSDLLTKDAKKVIGADINSNMLNQARIKYPYIEFISISPGSTPFLDADFDIILSAFVMLEFENSGLMLECFKELRRIIKSDGKLIFTTTSEHFPKNNWLTAKNNTLKNINIKSGDNYLVEDIKNGMVFSDFFYDDKTYQRIINDAGFIVDELYQPLGKDSDGIEWTLENKLPPYSIYICSPLL